MDDSDERFSLIPEDGDMLALLHLVSFDEVSLADIIEQLSLLTALAGRTVPGYVLEQ